MDQGQILQDRDFCLGEHFINVRGTAERVLGVEANHARSILGDRRGRGVTGGQHRVRNEVVGVPDVISTNGGLQSTSWELESRTDRADFSQTLIEGGRVLGHAADVSRASR